MCDHKKNLLFYSSKSYCCNNKNYGKMCDHKTNLLFYSSKSHCFFLSLSLAFTFSHNLPYSNHSVPHTSALDQAKALTVYFVFWILKIKKLEPSTSTEKMTASSDNSANVIDLFKLHYHDLREFDRNESAFEDYVKSLKKIYN